MSQIRDVYLHLTGKANLRQPIEERCCYRSRQCMGQVWVGSKAWDPDSWSLLRRKLLCIENIHDHIIFITVARQICGTCDRWYWKLQLSWLFSVLNLRPSGNLTVPYQDLELILFFWDMEFLKITYRTVIVLASACIISEATPGSSDIVERSFLEEEVHT